MRDAFHCGLTALSQREFCSTFLHKQETTVPPCVNKPDTPSHYGYNYSHFISKKLIYCFQYFIACIGQEQIHVHCSVKQLL
jgi:hypothetical protein